MGCEYRLLESEILDWLSLFGEVVSEITEELFDEVTDSTNEKMPPVGNVTYVVTMRLRKDMPNWYGRKVCLDCKGIRKQSV